MKLYNKIIHPKDGFSENNLQIYPVSSGFSFIVIVYRCVIT
ncbi:hypothetical protein AD23_5351 [Escherichia coli 2-005-03_S4_C3]|nr:hypothetical protein AD23_5351 [Escherichia coli 2-005-03_S4_C3]KDT36581.1 hypothetical protein AC67_5091 [Escherichia coli 2-052-05_S4_C1]